jgi:hypothetical protein
VLPSFRTPVFHFLVTVVLECEHTGVVLIEIDDAHHVPVLELMYSASNVALHDCRLDRRRWHSLTEWASLFPISHLSGTLLRGAVVEDVPGSKFPIPVNSFHYCFSRRINLPRSSIVPNASPFNSASSARSLILDEASNPFSA